MINKHLIDTTMAFNEAVSGKLDSHLINLQLGLCPLCGGPPGEFKDELSKREFAVSGICQKCQDEIFEE